MSCICWQHGADIGKKSKLLERMCKKRDESNLLPRFAVQSGFAAIVCWTTLQSMLAFKWLLSLSYCQNMLERYRLNMPEIADALMSYSYDEGHQIAEQVIQVLEAKRCKHDRIEALERNAAIWKHRALTSEEQLQARIAELEEEIQLFNGLEATIHGIATRQLQLQPDPEEQTMPTSEANDEQHDPDRARTLAVLADAGIQPYEDDEEDDTEQNDEDEG